MSQPFNVQYYISHGEGVKMHTLREKYAMRVFKGDAQTGGYIIEVYDFYVCNLSTDKSKAEEKAYKLTGKTVPFRSCDLAEYEKGQASRKAAHKEQKERAEQERKNAREAEYINKINCGKFPFGRWEGLSFTNAPDSYLHYWVNSEETDFAPAVALVAKLKELFPHLMKGNLPVPNGEHYHATEKREVFTATLICRFSFEGYYGTTRVYKFVKDTGELIVYMGSALLEIVKGDDCAPLQLGGIYSFHAAVKSQDVYEGEKQTMLARITKLNEV